MIPVPLLIQAYQSGFFPMAVENGEIRWFSPDPRGILPLDRLHVPRRLARVIRQGRFEIAIDRAFERVIAACAEPRDHEEDTTWISDEIKETYIELHRQGLAHSVETWEAGRLLGGLYGVSLRGAFFGESMFSLAPNASKVALHALVERLRARGFRLLDVQWQTPHLAQFGVIEIPRRKYLQILADSMRLDCRFD